MLEVKKAFCYLNLCFAEINTLGNENILFDDCDVTSKAV